MRIPSFRPVLLSLLVPGALAMTGCRPTPATPATPAAMPATTTAAATPAGSPATGAAAATDQAPGAGAPSASGGGGGPADQAAARFDRLYADYLAKAEPAATAYNLAWWEAANRGQQADFDRSAQLQLAYRQLHADRAVYAQLAELQAQDALTDPQRRRMLTVLTLAFKENQIDAALMKRLVDEGTALEQAFNTFRAQVDGKAVTANDIRQVLLTSDDSALRRRHYEASKAVGDQVAERLRVLVRQRNEAARSLGYANYYEMQLDLVEQEPARIAALFDEVARVTEAPFRQMKATLDARLSKRFGVPVEALRPWHYSDTFFQESPGVEGLDLDAAFANVDPRQAASRFYTGIGLDVAGILGRSDLYEKPGKVEHAFCTHIDRRGDVRVLANLKNDERWMGTLLHELGHGVFENGLDPALPWLLRGPAHSFVTEGVAELFGTLTRDPEFLAEFTTLPAETREKLAALAREDSLQDQLIFARWSLVMVHFERALYAAPEADLNKVWWDLVTRYQGITPPPERAGHNDWAAKIHVVTVPAYYHNYLLGRMFAAQLRQTLGEAVPQTMASGRLHLAGHPAVGQLLNSRVFHPGLAYRWDELVQKATGEPLSPRAFVAGLK